MAKQTLPTNFKDDILSSSMGGKRKYRIIDNGDGTYSLEDVTDYTQTGSDFGAGQINATNQAVNESCDKADVIDDLEDVVANQANGKIAGAKAVAKINGNLPRFSLSETASTSYTPEVDGFLTINYMPADVTSIILISTIDVEASLTIGTGLSQSGTRVAYTIPVVAGRSYRTDRSIARGTLSCRFMPLH